MAQQTYKGVLSTFSVGGSSQLAYLERAEIRVDPVLVETSSIGYLGGNNNETKVDMTISADLMSDTSSGRRSCHLQLSAATLGSVNLLSAQILGDLDFSIDYTIQQALGTSQKYAVPLVADRKFKATLKLAMDDGAAPSLLVKLGSSTYTDRDLTLDFTIDGVQVQVPMRVSSTSIPIEKDGLIHYTMDLEDRSARSGVTVLPSGSTSLLEKAINSSRTALAYSFQSTAANAIAIAGNMVWQSYKLSIRDRELAMVSASWLNTGTPSTFAGV